MFFMFPAYLYLNGYVGIRDFKLLVMHSFSDEYSFFTSESYRVSFLQFL